MVCCRKDSLLWFCAKSAGVAALQLGVGTRPEEEGGSGAGVTTSRGEGGKSSSGNVADPGAVCQCGIGTTQVLTHVATRRSDTLDKSLGLTEPLFPPPQSGGLRGASA